MTEHRTLAAALAAFQAEAPTVPKDKTAHVPTKSGGSYRYQYADLADVAAVAYPILAKHGLAFACIPRSVEGGGYELAGALMHASGERMEGALPLSGETPQALGSAITYARRYLLGAMTGIVTDVDDDAHLAQQSATGDHRPAPSATEPATDKQRGMLHGIARDQGVPDEEFVGWVARGIGRPITEATPPTKHEASDLIARYKEPS